MDKRKIFVLDDDLDFVNMVKIGLELNNYEVTTSTNGIEALEKIKNNKPDIVFVDIVIPEINGYQVCERLKQVKKTADIPIVLLTGKDLVPRSIEDRCLKLGIDSFMHKPVLLKEILSKIEEVLK